MIMIMITITLHFTRVTLITDDSVVKDSLVHCTFTPCYVYYVVKLQVGTELCLKY